MKTLHKLIKKHVTFDILIVRFYYYKNDHLWFQSTNLFHNYSIIIVVVVPWLFIHMSNHLGECNISYDLITFIKLQSMMNQRLHADFLICYFISLVILS